MGAVIDKLEAEAPRASTPARVRLSQNTLMPQGHYRQSWLVKAPTGATQDDCRYPDFFAAVARKLTRDDLVTIIAEDGSWEMETCVERVRNDGADISVRKVYAREPVKKVTTIVDDKGDFFTQWRAGEGWCVIRRSDDFPVVRGHSLEANAIAQWRREQPRRPV